MSKCTKALGIAIRPALAIACLLLPYSGGCGSNEPTSPNAGTNIVRAAETGTVVHGGALGRAAAGQPATSTMNAKMWRERIQETSRPGPGCYHAVFPQLSWTETPCAPPNESALHHLDNVGGGHHMGTDTFITAPTGLTFSGITGSFPSIGGGAETGQDGAPGYNGSNSYSIQLNTPKFSTTACGGKPGCMGWEQFVYNTNGSLNSTFTYIQIQYFLLGYDTPTCGANCECPTVSGHQFKPSDSIGDCAWVGPGVGVNPVMISNLTAVSLIGEAFPGQFDEVLFSTGTEEWTTGASSGSDVLGLGGNWHGAEFNVLGPPSGGLDGLGIASFSPGNTTITLQMMVNYSGSNSKVYPSCDTTATSSTGETNNLNIVGLCCLQPLQIQPSGHAYPAVMFMESNVPGATPPTMCDTAIVPLVGTLML